MTRATRIIKGLRQRGFKLTPKGQTLYVSPRGLTPEDCADIREFKWQILDALEAEARTEFFREQIRRWKRAHPPDWSRLGTDSDR